MFQGRNWLKGALDSLAEEQARFHRPTQPGQQSSSSPQAKRSSAQNRSSASQLPQQRRSDDAKDALADLASPDPDPAGFEPENIAQDAEGTTVSAELKLESSVEDPPAQSEAGVNESGNVLSISEPETEVKDSSPAFLGDQSPDVQSKLRKLGKLETKYQELLKAYRKAHARNSFIEPFEARLRECTPLTSISDPGAFVDYLNELNTKGGMVMEELKKVSGEKDALKQKLEEAERKTKEALDEVTQLRAQGNEPAEAATAETASETPAATHSIDSAPVTSPKSPSFGKRLFSPKQKAKVASEAQSEEMFSIDNEVPRLEEEIRKQGNQIGQLEANNEVVKNDLASARESTEQMMLDLEKAQKELEAVQALRTQSDEQHSQRVKTLEDTITKLEAKLKETEAEVDSCKAEIRARNEKISALEADIEAMPPARPDEGDGAEATPQGEDTPAEAETTASKKKKSKKKKKKGAGTASETADAKSTETSSREIVSQENGPKVASQSEIDEYVEQLKAKDAAIERLEAKMKSQEDLTDEIENLRDELINVGQEHVTVKEKLREVQVEKEGLEKRVGELEQELDNLKEGSETNREGNDQMRQSLQTELDDARSKSDALEAERITLSAKVESLEKEIEEQKNQASTSSTASSMAHSELSADFEDLKVKSKSLESDLSAAQQLAASRYKEMTSLRDLLQKAQPELVSLRTEVSELKTSRSELATKNKELRKLELREESLRGEIESLKRDAASKEEEFRLLNQRISAETSQRINMEESNRRAQRDLQRSQNERAEALSAKDTTSKELSDAKAQLDESRTKMQQLERQVEQLNQETGNLKDEISLKTAQHASAESLMTSVRDQAAEMATQMKEAKERCESLEDELTDAHRLMSERGREGETMRRLLSEVEGRAETRVKEMREKMDMAVQERDRAEDEASSIGRRRAREVDELKGKLRDLERDLRHATEDKTDLERIEKDLRHQKEDDARRIEQSAQEIADVRKAMGELRDALDDGEKQVRDYEAERTELKRSMEELQQRLERLQKSNKTMTDELRSLRATRIRPADSPSHSSRSSFESSRRVTSPTANSSTNTNIIGGAIHQSASQSSIARTTSAASGANSTALPALDYVYLKNVLLQFLEQKDKSHQMQLVPVLSMLLRFDRKDEQKWMAAIGAR